MTRSADKASGGTKFIGLWYDRPAENWGMDTLPIGNGRLGGMIFGGVARERVQFNEHTLWIGDETDTGAYQALGELVIDFDSGIASHYRRTLDLASGVHTTTFVIDGVLYSREYFASHPLGVLVFRFAAGGSGLLSGTISMRDARERVTYASGNQLAIMGNLGGHVHSLSSERNNYQMCLDYEARMVVCQEGGSLETTDGKLILKKADAFTIYLDGGTDYVNRREQNWRGEHPHRTVCERLAKAVGVPYSEALADHVRDYQQLFKRVSLDLGKTPQAVADLPTDQRLIAYRGGELATTAGSIYDGRSDDPSLNGVADPELEALLFQYARYLMIACSRLGGLPANLQGIWNDSNDPMWRCDYHTNINVQMNYWFVDAANLGECFHPLAEWIHAIAPVRREQTRQELGVRGWATRWENGIFGGATCPWSLGDAAWLALSLWDHYDFTRDQQYLARRVYPILKELCEFWEDSLEENATGRLVAPPSKSPEHGPVAAGNSYEQQLVHELFTNYIEAAKELGLDAPFREKVETMRARLLTPKIGRWGQLQEWAEDIDDPSSRHRHVSHMIGVYPGRQITPLATPELAEAAKVSMNARGDASTGWSRAWKICVWARLCDGNRAHRMLAGLIRTSLTPNLLATHPPFQIDANFGYAAGVVEMLLQSHGGSIQLLPALPAAWPKGTVRGIRCRGNYEVDIKWDAGRLVQARLRAFNDAICRLHASVPLAITCNGRRLSPHVLDDGVVAFAAEAGRDYFAHATD